SARPTADTRRTTLPTGAPRGRRGRPGHDRQPASETPADGSPLPETARADGTRQAPSDSARPLAAGHRADAPADDERPAGGGAGRRNTTRTGRQRPADDGGHRADASADDEPRRGQPGRDAPGPASPGQPVASLTRRSGPPGPSGAQGAQEQVREVVGD